MPVGSVIIVLRRTEDSDQRTTLHNTALNINAAQKLYAYAVLLKFLGLDTCSFCGQVPMTPSSECR